MKKLICICKLIYIVNIFKLSSGSNCSMYLSHLNPSYKFWCRLWAYLHVCVLKTSGGFCFYLAINICMFCISFVSSVSFFCCEANWDLFESLGPLNYWFHILNYFLYTNAKALLISKELLIHLLIHLLMLNALLMFNGATL